MKKILLLLSVIILMTQLMWGQTTYTWQGTDAASWATSTNWTPTRTTPATNDILQFNTGTTLSITSVPTQTIGRFVMSGNTSITLQSASAQILTIGNGTGTDMDIPSGSSLTLGSNLNITLAGSATASIAGILTIDNSGIVSKSGTITTSTSSATVTGSGTSFTTDAVANSLIYNSTGTCIGQVSSVASATSLTLTANATIALAGQAYKALAPTPTATFNTDGLSVVTTVTGTIVNRGTLTCASSTKLLLQGGSTFQHDVNNFTWPTATWDTTATFAVTGLATNSQGNPYPAFPSGVKNLIWDCPNQNFITAIAQSGSYC